MREGNTTVTILTLSQDPTQPLQAATKRYVDNNVANALSLSLAGTPAGQIIFSKGSTIGGNANLFFDNTNVRLGIGTSSPAYSLDFAGTAVSGRIGTGGDSTLMTSGTGLILSQSGDQYGPSSLMIMNRTGMNGAQFSTVNASAAVVDFLFSTGTTANTITRNFRFETRSGYQMIQVPEFHIGGASPDTPTFTVSDTEAGVNGNLLILSTAGVVQSSIGSATAPSYTFNGDLNTGMYDLGSDGIGFSLGGTSTFILNSNTAGSAATVNAVTALTYPVGNSAQRPTSPTVGMIRYNTDLTINEIWDQAWVPMHSFLHPGWANSIYYNPANCEVANTATANIATGTAYAMPFFRSTNMSFDRVGCEVTTSLSGGTCRLAIYDNALSATGGAPLAYPGALISDLGTVSAATAATKEITVSNVVVSPRWFWVVIMTSGTVGMRTMMPTSGGWIMGRTTDTGAVITSITASITYGAYPATFPTSITRSTAAFPLVWIRNV